MSKQYNLTISSSPHVRAAEDTRSIMLDVVIALMPALVGAVFFFGPRALVMTIISVVACCFFEWGYEKLLKRPVTVGPRGDMSAVVTGVLLAYCLPVTAPYWMLVIGDFFAIVIVKQLYGGLGKNFMNPALAGRAFLFSWPVIMTTWVVPGTPVSLFGGSPDAVTGATPLAAMHTGSLPADSLVDMFIGGIGGSLGETSALLLLIGGVYLVIRGVISLRIPLSYLLTVAVLTFIFPRGNNSLQWMLSHLFGGGLMLGAIFMATDYSSSPVTKKGQIIFGIGCGLITVLIRYFGSYNEGVSYAILIMNVCVWLLDKVGRPRRFGVSKEDAKAAKKKAKEEAAAAKAAAKKEVAAQ